MKRRVSRAVGVFSMSAIDLFAASMGAFALLAIILLPYYQNEIVENTPENAIADLLRAAELSQVETEEKRKALEKKREAASRNVSDIESQAQNLLAQLRAAENGLLEKQAAAQPAIKVPEPVAEAPAPTEAPKPTLATFRFLGMNTSKDDVAIALDMNRCLGGHEKTVTRAIDRIIDSLQDNHGLKIVGFQQTDSGPRRPSWPSTGGLRNVTPSSQQEAKSFIQGLMGSFGGSASMLDAFTQMLSSSSPAEAIFLVSDGLPNPRANDGLSPNALVSRITQLNRENKEIHTVVVGNYFDYQGTVEFMEELARRNNGQFMALASTGKGICD